ncbi:MAG TPA: glycosyltransferase, partial [Thermoanaerobaculia bacterium]|nr:glycosyltransferase [Thermoanaerobaculia bacterium]
MSANGPPVRCDLVIPVHNALRSTARCLRSVKRFAPPWARVVVVNDASDARTTSWLRAQEGIVLVENPANLGFVRSANRGLLFSDAPWVCLLNSDTLMTEGALERMVARCEQDPKIALCCPLSNEAVNLSVRLPPGADVFSFAQRVSRTSPALYPDAVTVVGFCLLVRREAIRALGVFDEVFGMGYGEETDLHYRARTAGWRGVVADDTFVYHRHGASFADRDERVRRNLEIVMSRWRSVHERELAEFDRTDALGAVRDARTFAWTRPDGRPPAPHDVLFVLPSLGPSDAASAVIDLANVLILEGVRTGVAVLGETFPEIPDERFFEPFRLTECELITSGPPARLLVATDTRTAAVAAVARSRNPALKTALLLTDSDETGAEACTLIPGIAVPTAALARTIESRYGLRPFPLGLGVDPDVFYPRRERPAPPPVRIAASLGPGNRSGAPALLAALAEAARRPGVEVVLHGPGSVPADAAFPYRHLGLLPPERVADLLSTAHVAVDTSDSAGFPLRGLEAMACGAASVLVRSAAAQYAADGEIALLVAPGDAPALSRAILRLVDEPALREKLAANGLEAAGAHAGERADLRFREFLDSLTSAEPLP